MKIIPLPLETATEHKANLLVELTFADLTDDDAAQTIPLFPVAAKIGVWLVEAKLATAFDSSSDATLISTTVTVGDGGSATRFLASQELNPSGTEVYVKAGALTGPYEYTTDDYVDAFLACTAAKLLSAHTQGVLQLFFQITDGRVAS